MNMNKNARKINRKINCKAKVMWQINTIDAALKLIKWIKVENVVKTEFQILTRRRVVYTQMFVREDIKFSHTQYSRDMKLNSVDSK